MTSIRVNTVSSSSVVDAGRLRVYPDSPDGDAAPLAEPRMPVNVWTVTAAAVDRRPGGRPRRAPVRRRPGRMSRRWLGISNGIAAGFMSPRRQARLAGLRARRRAALPGPRARRRLRLGFRRLIGDRDDLALGGLAGADALKALVIVAVMTVHSAARVSASASPTAAASASGSSSRSRSPRTTCPRARDQPRARPARASVRSAAWWSVFSCLPQPLIAPFTYLFVEWFSAVLPAGLGFAAGAMLWIVCSELLPEACGAPALPALASGSPSP